MMLTAYIVHTLARLAGGTFPSEHFHVANQTLTARSLVTEGSIVHESEAIVHLFFVVK